ncbi:MAG: hypothetical protein CM1200mP40_05790 [Gammaproteobacteria bacterium]|nr:MAG: hypothetical protein CM1200mP40_05790 [Gammaproteobacteria bacterium]
MKSTSFSKFLSIFPLLILPIQSTVLGQEADAAADSTVTYPASYFAQFSPVSVNDMLDRIPGIELALQGGDSDPLSRRFRGGNRGLGGLSQILIDGKRLAGKANEARSQLNRITANEVDYIEIYVVLPVSSTCRIQASLST